MLLKTEEYQTKGRIDAEQGPGGLLDTEAFLSLIS